MSEVKSGFRRLLELTDKSAREELNSYYIISESRMDNYLNCLENGAKQIAELRAQLAEAQKEIERLTDQLRLANIDWQNEVAENAALKAGLKPVEYPKYAFCKDVECAALENEKCQAYVCRRTAWGFHEWLNQNGYKIIKATCEE